MQKLGLTLGGTVPPVSTAHAASYRSAGKVIVVCPVTKKEAEFAVMVPCDAANEPLDRKQALASSLVFSHFGIKLDVRKAQLVAVCGQEADEMYNAIE